MNGLEAWMREHGMTQGELAAEVGVSQSSVARALAGRAAKQVAFKISDRTGLSPIPMMRPSTPSDLHAEGDDTDTDPEGSA